jgi:hypothetical protein
MWVLFEASIWLAVVVERSTTAHSEPEPVVVHAGG